MADDEKYPRMNIDVKPELEGKEATGMAATLIAQESALRTKSGTDFPVRRGNLFDEHASAMGTLGSTKSLTETISKNAEAAMDRLPNKRKNPIQNLGAFIDQLLNSGDIKRAIDTGKSHIGELDTQSDLVEKIADDIRAQEQAIIDDPRLLTESIIMAKTEADILQRIALGCAIKRKVNEMPPTLLTNESYDLVKAIADEYHSGRFKIESEDFRRAEHVLRNLLTRVRLYLKSSKEVTGVRPSIFFTPATQIREGASY